MSEFSLAHADPEVNRFANAIGRKDGPVERFFLNSWPQPVKDARARDGLGWESRNVELWLVNTGFAIQTERVFMVVIDQLKANYEAISSLWGGYKSELDKFRAVAKNDLQSLEAAARKTTEAARKLNSAYGEVITQLNSVEFARAIDNAERLANAMQSLAALQTQKLVFSVVENQTP